jgi:hypothetical protein
MKLWLFSVVLFVAMTGIAIAEESPSTQPAAPAVPAATQPTASNTQMQGWFDDLASTEPVVRENARMELLGLSRDQLPALRVIVQNSHPIVPAQSAALHDIVTHVFLSGERYELAEGLQRQGFLGVMLTRDQNLIAPLDIDGNVDEDAGVLVQDCMPGFCGFRYLRPGDLIMALQTGPDEFMRTTTQSGLISTISSLPPAAPLTLRLVRQGQLISVTLPLSERPRVADQNTLMVEEWRSARIKMAIQYWETFFLPLLGGHVS